MQRSSRLLSAAFLVGSTVGATLATAGPDEIATGDLPTLPPTPPADPPPAPAEPPPSTTTPAPPAPAPPAPEPARPSSGIRGRIVDADTGEPIADIAVATGDGATATTATTDPRGEFELAVAPGTYTLRISGDLYRRHRVRGIAVRRGVTRVDIKLSPEVIEEVVVLAPPDTGSEAVQVVRRRKRATVSDAISSEQIARSPDSSASDAAKRVVGATVQDGKYVVIRGLGGRYSLTLLNGVPLPSPDPDVPAAPLDLFPAALLANLTVTKTFSPNLPANFAGGALSIETRSFPSKFTLKVRGGMSADSEASFQDLNGYQGGSLDALGFDDGTRALPAAIPRDQLAGDYSLTPEQIDAQMVSFSDTWAVERAAAQPNGSLGVTIGDTLSRGKQRLGYFASANYGRSYNQRRGHVAAVGESDGEGGFIPSTLQLDEDLGRSSAALSGLLTSGWSYGSTHNVGLIALYTHTADDSASVTTGVDSNTSAIERTRLQFVEREMAFAQLLGESTLAGGRVLIGWQANASHVGQDEPDTRDVVRVLSADGRYAIDTTSGSSERLFSELGDRSGGGGLDVTIPLDRVKLVSGASYLYSSRGYQARRFHWSILDPESLFLSPEMAFADANADHLSFYEATLPSDGYQATRAVSSAYAMADVAITDELRALGGVRFERSELDLNISSTVDQGELPPLCDDSADGRCQRDDDNLLPSLNLVYAVDGSSNLRAAYGMTVARPNFREVAPSLYYDYVRRRAIGGNPDLRTTTVHNVDLRWERFLAETELVAASLFYKRFVDPIERTLEDAGSGANVGFSNAAGAASYGVELEGRISLGRFGRDLANFDLGANLAIIRSSIDLMGAERALQGQSPYVLNLDLGYARARSGTQVNLLYNAFGRRIEEVGTGGAGDVYEQPFHRVDLTVSQKLRHDLKLKVAGGNLLHQRVSRTQNGVPIYAYQAPTSVVLGLELSVE